MIVLPQAKKIPGYLGTNPTQDPAPKTSFLERPDSASSQMKCPFSLQALEIPAENTIRIRVTGDLNGCASLGLQCGEQLHEQPLGLDSAQELEGGLCTAPPPG